jgi:hypothetical protein
LTFCKWDRCKEDGAGIYLNQETLRVRKALDDEGRAGKEKVCFQSHSKASAHGYVRLAVHKEETFLAVSQPKRAPGLKDPEQEKAGETKGELELL